jgi:hypothetical protein
MIKGLMALMALILRKPNPAEGLPHYSKSSKVSPKPKINPRPKPRLLNNLSSRMVSHPMPA